MGWKQQLAAANSNIFAKSISGNLAAAAAAVSSIFSKNRLVTLADHRWGTDVVSLDESIIFSKAI
jgi:hypothetical protein